MPNRVDPDQLPHSLASVLGLHYLVRLSAQILMLSIVVASENVVCLCGLLNILANFSNLFFAYGQTVWTQIRLLLKEQSDLGPHYLQKLILKSQADDKTDDNSCDWRFKG